MKKNDENQFTTDRSSISQAEDPTRASSETRGALLPLSRVDSIPESFTVSLPRSDSGISPNNGTGHPLAKMIPSSLKESVCNQSREPILPELGQRELMVPSFTVGPMDDGKLVYMRVAPPEKVFPGKGMLYFWMDIVNENSQTLTLEKIVIKFMGGSETDPLPSERNEPIIKSSLDSPKRVYLRKSEAILIKKIPRPTEVFVELKFEEFSLPISITLPLGPRLVSYEFFARDDFTSTFGKYIIMKGGHSDPHDTGGSQALAQDTTARGWVDGKLQETNKAGDNFIVGRPLYAMGDGIVIDAVDTNSNNPEPGVRLVVRRPGWAQIEDTFKDIAVVCRRCKTGEKIEDKDVFSNRILVAMLKDKTSQLMLVLFEQDNAASSVVPLAQEVAPVSAQKVLVSYVDDNTAVTITTPDGMFNSNAQMVVWDIPIDASIGLEQKDQMIMPAVSAVRVLPITPPSGALGKWIVTISKASGSSGMLTMSLWTIFKKKISLLTTWTFGPVKLFDLAAIDGRRFVTAVQLKADDTLKVIAWEIEFVDIVVGWKFKRLGEDTRGKVSEISAVDIANENEPGLFGVAVQQQDKTVKLFLWKTDAAGAVIRLPAAYTGKDPVSMIRAVNFKKKSIAIFSKVATGGAGKLRMTPMDVKVDENEIVSLLLYTELDTSGTTDLYCVAELGTPQTTLVAVVRTSEGFAKTILYQYSNNNIIRIRYGAEIVTCGHLKQGSIPNDLIPHKVDDVSVAVSADDVIGEMGDSGSGTGPHMHIHVGRIKDKYRNHSPQQLRKVYDAEVDPTDPRPLQFHGVKTSLLAIVETNGPQGVNNFHTTDNEGFFFDYYAVLPNKKP